MSDSVQIRFSSDQIQSKFEDTAFYWVCMGLKFEMIGLSNIERISSVVMAGGFIQSGC